MFMVVAMGVAVVVDMVCMVAWGFTCTGCAVVAMGAAALAPVASMAKERIVSFMVM
jgi:hypothetical protein